MQYLTLSGFPHGHHLQVFEQVSKQDIDKCLNRTSWRTTAASQRQDMDIPLTPCGLHDVAIVLKHSLCCDDTATLTRVVHTLTSLSCPLSIRAASGGGSGGGGLQQRRRSWWRWRCICNGQTALYNHYSAALALIRIPLPLPGPLLHLNPSLPP